MTDDAVLDLYASADVADPSSADRLADALRRRVISIRGESSVVRVLDVARILNCRVRGSEEIGKSQCGVSGFLRPLRGKPRFEIVYSAREGRPRQRFTVAHELGHTFFYDATTSPSSRRDGPTVGEERFCDRFAGALLLPSSLLPTSLDPALCLQIAQEQHLSPFAVAVRAQQCERLGWDALFGLRWKLNPKTHDRPALRVDWVVSRPGVYIPLHAKPRFSIPVDAFFGTPGGTDTCAVRLGSMNGECERAVSLRGRSLVVGVRDR